MLHANGTLSCPLAAEACAAKAAAKGAVRAEEARRLLPTARDTWYETLTHWWDNERVLGRALLSQDGQGGRQ